jgi:hypothetical protein
MPAQKTQAQASAKLAASKPTRTISLACWFAGAKKAYWAVEPTFNYSSNNFENLPVLAKDDPLVPRYRHAARAAQAFLAAQETASTDPNPTGWGNIAEETVLRGADCSMGWTVELNFDRMPEYAQYMWDALCVERLDPFGNRVSGPVGLQEAAQYAAERISANHPGEDVSEAFFSHQSFGSYSDVVVKYSNNQHRVIPYKHAMEFL